MKKNSRLVLILSLFVGVSTFTGCVDNKYLDYKTNVNNIQKVIGVANTVGDTVGNDRVSNKTNKYQNVINSIGR